MGALAALWWGRRSRPARKRLGRRKSPTMATGRAKEVCCHYRPTQAYER